VGTDKIMIKGGGGGEGTGWGKKEEINEERIGRFPANLLHDNSEEVRECFPETKSGKIKPYTEKPISPSSFNFVGRKKPAFDYADNGNASRFFKSIIYTPKASKSERNKGCEELPNNHPTVKPIALMEYLINMITPKGGVVLDPFMGSGSTGVACKNLKREFIGIEKEAEYLKIAEARINGTPDKLL
jgi:DNA modification methylase